ncbi:unknown [Rickettsia felis URRWXCal2]|uniref:Uncharacterized protein n=3 Tax=Rickettsia felis TaxID=42862 RepID=Q4ULA0_RICFE|nr:unknown [Rickettsia felis URRWXCal2]
MKEDIIKFLVGIGIIGIVVCYFMIKEHINAEINSGALKLFERRKEELEFILQQKKQVIVQEINERTSYNVAIRKAFEENYIKGRHWLAEYIAEADKACDSKISHYLQTKKHPAPSAAKAVQEAKAEKRALLKQVKFLEYQIKSYKEYFPFLEEFEEEIVNEHIDFITENTSDIIDNIDRAALYLSKEEYQKLSTEKRNQLALDRYIERTKEK